MNISKVQTFPFQTTTPAEPNSHIEKQELFLDIESNAAKDHMLPLVTAQSIYSERSKKIIVDDLLRQFPDVLNGIDAKNFYQSILDTPGCSIDSCICACYNLVEILYDHRHDECQKIINTLVQSLQDYIEKQPSAKFAFVGKLLNKIEFSLLETQLSIIAGMLVLNHNSNVNYTAVRCDNPKNFFLGLKKENANLVVPNLNYFLVNNFNSILVKLNNDDFKATIEALQTLFEVTLSSECNTRLNNVSRNLEEFEDISALGSEGMKLLKHPSPYIKAIGCYVLIYSSVLQNSACYYPAIFEVLPKLLCENSLGKMRITLLNHVIALGEKCYTQVDFFNYLCTEGSETLRVSDVVESSGFGDYSKHVANPEAISRLKARKIEKTITRKKPSFKVSNKNLLSISQKKTFLNPRIENKSERYSIRRTFSNLEKLLLQSESEVNFIQQKFVQLFLNCQHPTVLNVVSRSFNELCETLPIDKIINLSYSAITQLLKYKNTHQALEFLEILINTSDLKMKSFEWVFKTLVSAICERKNSQTEINTNLTLRLAKASILFAQRLSDLELVSLRNTYILIREACCSINSEKASELSHEINKIINSISVTPRRRAPINRHSRSQKRKNPSQIKATAPNPGILKKVEAMPALQSSSIIKKKNTPIAILLKKTRQKNCVLTHEDYKTLDQFLLNSKDKVFQKTVRLATKLKHNNFNIWEKVIERQDLNNKELSRVVEALMCFAAPSIGTPKEKKVYKWLLTKEISQVSDICVLKDIRRFILFVEKHIPDDNERNEWYKLIYQKCKAGLYYMKANTELAEDILSIVKSLRLNLRKNLNPVDCFKFDIEYLIGLNSKGLNRLIASYYALKDLHTVFSGFSEDVKNILFKSFIGVVRIVLKNFNAEFDKSKPVTSDGVALGLKLTMILEEYCKQGSTGFSYQKCCQLFNWTDVVIFFSRYTSEKYFEYAFNLCDYALSKLTHVNEKQLNETKEAIVHLLAVIVYLRKPTYARKLLNDDRIKRFFMESELIQLDNKMQDLRGNAMSLKSLNFYMGKRPEVITSTSIYKTSHSTKRRLLAESSIEPASQNKK